jgi:hypothetical protein
MTLLQSFKNAPLIVERYYSKDKQVTLAIYPSDFNAITGGSKVPSTSKTVEKVDLAASLWQYISDR